MAIDDEASVTPIEAVLARSAPPVDGPRAPAPLVGPVTPARSLHATKAAKPRTATMVFRKCMKNPSRVGVRAVARLAWRAMVHARVSLGALRRRLSPGLPLSRSLGGCATAAFLNAVVWSVVRDLNEPTSDERQQVRWSYHSRRGECQSSRPSEPVRLINCDHAHTCGAADPRRWPSIITSHRFDNGCFALDEIFFRRRHSRAGY